MLDEIAPPPPLHRGQPFKLKTVCLICLLTFLILLTCFISNVFHIFAFKDCEKEKIKADGPYEDALVISDTKTKGDVVADADDDDNDDENSKSKSNEQVESNF